MDLMHPEGSRAVSTTLPLAAGSQGQGASFRGHRFRIIQKLNHGTDLSYGYLRWWEVSLILSLSAKVKI